MVVRSGKRRAGSRMRPYAIMARGHVVCPSLVIIVVSDHGERPRQAWSRAGLPEFATGDGRNTGAAESPTRYKVPVVLVAVIQKPMPRCRLSLQIVPRIFSCIASS